jgi:ArsR family transcriptional regulator, arsenate/arsenite/antimonite-responsive transcriptional repressor
MSARRKIELSQQQFESIGRALADPRRYAILQQIASQSGMGCSALEAHQHISAPTISHHLKELQESGLIEIAREGRTACLSLRRDIWESYLHRLAKL